MMPFSLANNFSTKQHHKSYKRISSRFFSNRGSQYCIGSDSHQEGVEPIIVSSMKQRFNEMGEERLTAVASLSGKEEPRYQQQPSDDGIEHEIITDGSVAVVQPSFDDHDGRSPVAEKKCDAMNEKRSSPTNDHVTSLRPKVESHKRNLSEHFQDATSLESGQKHRREYSEDLQHAAQAHRRINSIGNAKSIQRGKPHRRIDSSGLDALTAAADFSREELEAASAASSHRRQSWNQSSGGNMRRSPGGTIPVSSAYDRHAGKEPVVSQHPPPLPPSPHTLHSNNAAASVQHRHFSSLSSSGGLPSRSMYYSHQLHPSYNQPPYTHASYYHHPGNHHVYGTHSQLPPPPPGGYPVQYSRGGLDSFKQPIQLQQQNLDRAPVESTARGTSTTSSINDNTNRTVTVSNGGMEPPVAPSWRRGGSTQGVQTYITGIGVGETTRTIEANPALVPSAGHHRKLSSFSNLGPFLFGSPSQQIDAHGSGGHHRKSSSSISFLNVLDSNLNESSDAAFLRNLQESTGTPAAAYDNNTGLAIKTEHPNVNKLLTVPANIISDSVKNEDNNSPSKLMMGGTSKRVRRKCTIEGCRNRVVQGGLCIAHGAKRKQCKHPGCTKHVKKAGLCSTHGPARKRCEFKDCGKVAVQGGRCIAHGAKKKLCSVDACTKQAILAGMCKKHHDQSELNSAELGQPPAICKVVPKKTHPASKLSSGSTASSKNPGHTRGLSIFQEISPDTVGDLLSGDAANAAKKVPPAPESTPSSSTSQSHSNHHHRSTVSREFTHFIY